MTTRDQEEQDLRITIMQTDLALKRKQTFWETPKSLAIVVGATAAIVGAVAGLAGYKIGQQSSQPQTIIVQQPPPRGL